MIALNEVVSIGTIRVPLLQWACQDLRGLAMLSFLLIESVACVTKPDEKTDWQLVRLK
jgi:hypothetical protein